MRNIQNKILRNAMTGVALLLLINPFLNAAGTSSAQFLKLGAGARAAGMGQAFSGVADDATAAYWNPAGLTQLDNPELSLMQNNWLMDSAYQFAGFALPVKSGAFGISLQRMDYGTIDAYSNSNTAEGSFDAGSTAGALTYATQMSSRLHLGLTGKFIQESIESESASTFAGDIGAMAHFEHVKVGLVYQNLGPGLKFVDETCPLPQTIRLGMSSQFINQKLLTSLEISKPNDNDASIHVGAEYKAMSFATFRAGYQITPGNTLDVDGLTDISGGMGLNFGRFLFDYAFLPFGDLGNSHQVSLLVKFR